MVPAVRRLVVVGGSSGIGRAVAVHAAAQGHDVTVLARRTIDDVPSFSVDVRDDDAIARALEKFDELDAVVYAAGMAQLGELAAQSSDSWRAMFDTNVIGAALVAKHAVPRLAPHGVMFFVSSTNDDEHWWGLNAYGASKAALNRLVVGLAHEHTDLRFVRATVGPTVGTEFGTGWDAQELGRAWERWIDDRDFTAQQMPLDDLAVVIVSTLNLLLDHPKVNMPEVHLEPPGQKFKPSPAPPADRG